MRTERGLSTTVILAIIVAFAAIAWLVFSGRATPQQPSTLTIFPGPLALETLWDFSEHETTH